MVPRSTVLHELYAERNPSYRYFIAVSFNPALSRPAAMSYLLYGHILAPPQPRHDHHHHHHDHGQTPPQVAAHSPYSGMSRWKVG